MHELVLNMRSGVFAAAMAICLWSAATPGQTIPYGNGVGSPDGRYTAIYIGGAIRIEENPAGENPVRVGVFAVYTLNWTGDSRALVLTEHLAGGSQAALIYLDGGTWKRIEIDPIDVSYDDQAVVGLLLRDHSIRVTYKLRHSENQDIQLHLYSVDIDTITRIDSNEKLEKITAAKYNKLGNWPAEASIRIAYPRHSE